ncbi:protein CREG1-like [Macrosteles quadrilineatus]|uniref:protein CREG1-like n=1 Tax=Macrosteles quadrilineatus TaxID=74068 RepID=UPI0023E29659|nr:protein CREG1-like [Macrosteles quadrilineatus]XP_054287158.1 protein CREG1-like [Macrosteles quadrilineatus]XP_054289024.1 protein CREG1-like [Macrosteles quadrilineatus]XP_054289025.1 protein CREG1-like [Macrosteles quadrilineatus]
MCLKFVVVGLLFLCGTTSLGIQVVDMNHESSNVKSHTPDPPPKNETARMARYIVHYSDWCALAHISHHSNTSGFPVARVYSTADGFYDTTTGMPYFYVSKMDAHINDLDTDSKCSVTMSLAEGNYCRKESLDPEDPRCAQVILTGKFIFLDPSSKEWQLAKAYLFQRHPVMSSWPEEHHWQVGKLKIGQIQVADNFGGSAYPSVKDYFDALP